MSFEPWAHGEAKRDGKGKITGTIPLKADAGLRILAAEVHGDGQFLTVTFEELDPHKSRLA